MLKAIPMSWAAANAFVAARHRHSGTCRGQKFAVGATCDGILVGVMMAGRPVARAIDDGMTLEVLRVCTDGTRNCCSFLYSRAMDIAERMGYMWVITYTLASETGSSIISCRRSSEEPARVCGKQADTPKRRRKIRAETPERLRWTLSGQRQFSAKGSTL